MILEKQVNQQVFKFLKIKSLLFDYFAFHEYIFTEECSITYFLNRDKSEQFDCYELYKYLTYFNFGYCVRRTQANQSDLGMS